MTRTCTLAGIGLAACLCLLAGPRALPADETKADPAAEKPKAIEQIALAYQLLEYGRTQKLPEAYLTAVDLLWRTPAEEFTGKVEGDGERVKAKSPIDELTDLLNQAKRMRPDDKHIVALADRMAERVKETSRGIVGGRPQQVVLNLKPRQTSSVTFAFDPLDALAVGRNTASGINFRFVDVTNPAAPRVVRTSIIGAGANFTLRQRISARTTFRLEVTNNGTRDTAVQMTVQ